MHITRSPLGLCSKQGKVVNHKMKQNHRERNQFNGSSKELDKLLNMIESMVVYAPTTAKHTKRMHSFARNKSLLDFIDDSFNLYFKQNNHSLNEASEQVYYDAIQTWYLFAMLVYSYKLANAVIQIISKIAKSPHPHLFIARRILNLCENLVYDDDQVKNVCRYYFC